MTNSNIAGNTQLREAPARTGAFNRAPNSAALMNVLYFAQQQIWPVNSGARMRNYYLARELATSASVTFVEMGTPGEELSLPPADSGLARLVSLQKGPAYTAVNVLRGLAGPTPVTVLNCWSQQSASELANVLQSHKFDTVQIEGVHLLQYLPSIQKAIGRTHIVADWHNIESELMWRYARTTDNWVKKVVARRTAQLIERAENKLLSACGTHIVTSERERQKLLARHPAANVYVVPNGVDASIYYAPEIADARRRAARSDSKRTLLFVGSMDYHANIDGIAWFSKNVWPEIARNHPELQFAIVGRNPTPEIRALACDRIQVTGTVDDVRPFYASALAVVVPLRSGSGTRLKILESMAAGVPVISTGLGIEGIDAEQNEHFLHADSVSEIVAAVNLLASSVEMRTRLSEAARALIVNRYDWSIVGEQLYRIHRDIAHQGQPNSLGAPSWETPFAL